MDEHFEADAERALDVLRRIVQDHAGCGYRIGRCAAADLPRLFARGENAAARLFRVLARGSRTESDLLQRILVRRGRTEFRGALPLPPADGTPPPEADHQVVYVIVMGPEARRPARRVA